jgi:hypothetical protein
MTDGMFEARLARDIVALADGEISGFDVRRIADQAIASAPPHGRREVLRMPRPRSLTVHRLVLAGMTALLLLLLLVLGISGAPSPVPPDSHAAILIRPPDDATDDVRFDGDPDPRSVEIVLARADGRSEVVRSIKTTDIAPDATGIQLAGAVSADGWLFLYPSRRVVLPSGVTGFVTALFDLRDPDRPAAVIPSNGAMGPRFGPDGLVAFPCGAPPRCDGFGSHQVLVMDLDEPDAGARTISGVPFLGGGPEIVWAADGSGFLEEGPASGWGVKPLDGGPYRPGFPRVLSRRIAADVPGHWLGGGHQTAAGQYLGDGQMSATGDSIWQLAQQPDDPRLTLDRIAVDRSTTTTMGRLPVELPPGRGDSPTMVGLSLSPDDTVAAVTVDPADGSAPYATLFRTSDADANAPGVMVPGRLMGWVTDEAARRIAQHASD